MPSSLVVPGEKLSMRTSATEARASRRRLSGPAFRSRTALRLPRFHTRYPDRWLQGSPSGGSILVTLAPWSASNIPVIGPVIPQERSSTFTPSRTPMSVRLRSSVTELIVCTMTGAGAFGQLIAPAEDAVPQLDSVRFDVVVVAGVLENEQRDVARRGELGRQLVRPHGDVLVADSEEDRHVDHRGGGGRAARNHRGIADNGQQPRSGVDECLMGFRRHRIGDVEPRTATGHRRQRLVVPLFGALD